MLHSTCWAHILHLVSEELRLAMPEADKFISSMKAALTKAPGRRSTLLQILSEFEYPATLPPVPILTRWATWVAAADYYWRNFDAIQEFIKRSAVDSAAVRNLQDIVQNADMVQQLERLSKVFQGLKSSILNLENDNVSAASVWLNINACEELLKHCGLKSDKLHLDFHAKHPALAFWTEVQAFDPRRSKDFMKDHTIPESLKRFLKTAVPLHEIVKYEALVASSTFSGSEVAFQFWSNFQNEMPNLSKLALTALCVPGSSASVERSFSQLKRVYTAARTSLTEDNLEIHLKILYNKNCKMQVCEFSDEDNDDLDDE